MFMLETGWQKLSVSQSEIYTCVLIESEVPYCKLHNFMHVNTEVTYPPIFALLFRKHLAQASP